MSESRRLEDWLDGRLSPPDRAELEARLAREPGLRREVRLQRGIDASLRRTYGVPVGLLDRLEASLGAGAAERLAPPPPARRSRPTWRRLLVVAAAAAFLVAPLLLLRRSAPVPAGPVDTLAHLPGASLEPAAPAPRPTGSGGRVRQPDLGSLYDAVTEEELTGEECADGAARDDLQRTLASRYGEGLSVDPRAESLLDGPFVSSEWPSGTVLAGLPDGPGGRPSVLIAEHESEASCCLSLLPPADGSLHVFTYLVGDVFLTEVTPHDQPALLQLFVDP